jgi:P-type Cu+ transporter
MRTQTEEPLMSQDYNPSGLSYSPGLRVKEEVNRGQSDRDHPRKSADVIVLDRAADASHPVMDLVCGMTVDANKTPHHAEHQRRTYYFCSGGCREKFIADPQRYLEGGAQAPEPMPEGTIHTCPMHPEIWKSGLGSCPICGMALDPVLVAADTPPNPELVDMTRRFWVGLTLTLPVAALQMGGHFTELHIWLEPRLANWAQFALATPIVLWAG